MARIGEARRSSSKISVILNLELLPSDQKYCKFMRRVNDFIESKTLKSNQRLHYWSCHGQGEASAAIGGCPIRKPITYMPG